MGWSYVHFVSLLHFLQDFFKNIRPFRYYRHERYKRTVANEESSSR